MDAIKDLPFFLDNGHATDDDVVDFTQNGGWQKINNLIPSLFHKDKSLPQYFNSWLLCLRRFSNHLKVSHSSLH